MLNLFRLVIFKHTIGYTDNRQITFPAIVECDRPIGYNLEEFNYINEICWYAYRSLTGALSAIH